ncbi:MAG: 50S ribosomal protein L9 [Spirochaetes bacterium]|nr:50S ribosomal protein L9 [Spirochaetota bacterium]MBU1081361.1 50S ribosomal protein L9 [Spirochaetota bacterium]
MKVILNNDVPNLGELGDVKDVAAGYARNFLLPRGLVFPYSPSTVAMFEKRKAEIEQRKAEKRASSSDLKTKLEADELVFDMPAGANGKLFGAVSNASVADELLKKGINVDRKKIEVPGRVIKSVGNYKVVVRLYEKDEATVRVVVKGHVEKAKQSSPAPEQARRRRYEEQAQPAQAEQAQAADTVEPVSAPEAESAQD